MRKIDPLWIRLFGDALLPILGYFLWDWGLYFISFYYLIDLLAAELLLHVKANKIVKTQELVWNTRVILERIVTVFLLLVIIFLTYIALKQLFPTKEFFTEFVLFWNYKDMGIAQGYILLPLIVLVTLQRYKTEFVIPGKHKTKRLQQLFKKRRNALLIMLGFLGLTLGMNRLVQFPDFAYIFAIVLLTSFYQVLYPEYE